MKVLSTVDLAQVGDDTPNQASSALNKVSGGGRSNTVTVVLGAPSPFAAAAFLNGGVRRVSVQPRSASLTLRRR